MAKRGGKSEGETPVVTEAEIVPDKQAKRIMQPGGCRSYMRRKLANEFPAIVQGFVKEAKKGSVTHVKLATELLKPQRKGTSRKKSTAQRLLEQFGED